MRSLLYKDIVFREDLDESRHGGDEFFLSLAMQLQMALIRHICTGSIPFSAK